LRSGDEVEIIRDHNHLPPSNWENIAATGKARSAIRRAVRQAAQQRAFALGEHVLAVILEREAVSIDDAEGKALGEALGFAGKRELLVAVGEGKVASDAVATELAAVKGLRKRRTKKIDLPVPDKAEGWFALRATDVFRFRVPGGQRSGPNARSALEQLGFNTAVSVSPEGVVPGDRLVGIMRPGAPIEVYPIHSDALVELHDSDVAWIDVRWDMTGREHTLHKAAISVLSVNRPGSLAHLSGAIAACEANIHNMTMRMDSPDLHKFIIELEVRDLAQLTDVLSQIKLTSGLSSARRATIAEASALSTLEWAEPARPKEPA
jgi:guanosine-3',5'-bis(diphosphate) 3'-pyrophosphohydrolase